MKSLRIGYRLSGFALVTAVLFVLRIAPGPLLRRLESGKDREWRDTMFGLWARLTRRLIGMRIVQTGPLPRSSPFVVTNHLGYVDIVLLANLLPSVFVAKAEVAAWPLLGRAVRSVGTIFVDRRNKSALGAVNRDIMLALSDGDRVVLFAEGTSSQGDRVLPLKPALLHIPAMQERPVSYAAIRYATPAGYPEAREAVCWWGDMRFMRHFLGLLALPGFTANVRFGKDAVIDHDRKRLAKRLQESIGAELAEIR